jgi:SAM-dependent methyltransferase
MELDNDFFDVVTLWDVLEHTPDPKHVLLECWRVLKPGGLLVVNYPDIDSMVSRIMGRKWVFLLSVHLYYFTPLTIRKILEDTGFKFVDSAKHWQSLELGYILFRMGPYLPKISNYIHNLVKKLGMNQLRIPYWMGQVLIIAER